MKYSNFDRKHSELIKSFFDLYVSNQEFSKRWKRDFRGALDFNYFDKIDREMISTITQEAFKTLFDLFNECIEEILKNKNVPKPKINNNDVVDSVFRGLLTDLLDNLAKSFSQNLSFLQPHQVLDVSYVTLYPDYRKYLFARKQVFKIFVFLSNFSLKTNSKTELRLLKDVKIVEDVDYFFDKDEFLGIKKDTALVFEYNTDKFGNVGNTGNGGNGIFVVNGFTYPHEEIKNELFAILTSFRLLKQGDVGVLATKIVNPSPFSKPRSIPIDLDFLVQFRGSIFDFSESDLKGFRSIYKKLKPNHNTKELNICISRFNKSYIKNDISDQIIDLVIAMEAITTNTWDSLSYKVKTQLARLIEKDATKRKELAAKINNIYGIRGDLVHGGQTKEIGSRKSFANNRDLLECSREIMRQAINKILKLFGDGKKLTDIFDKVIFS